MKFITKEEKDAMVIEPKYRQSPLRTMLQRLEIGEIIYIESHEWTLKSAKPSYLCRRLEAKSDKRFECEEVLSPGSGWVITRWK